MPSGYATRTRAKGDAGTSADEKLWKRRLERERVENAKLRARIEELEAAGAGIVKDKAARLGKKVRDGVGKMEQSVPIVDFLKDNS